MDTKEFDSAFTRLKTSIVMSSDMDAFSKKYFNNVEIYLKPLLDEEIYTPGQLKYLVLCEFFKEIEEKSDYPFLKELVRFVDNNQKKGISGKTTAESLSSAPLVAILFLINTEFKISIKDITDAFVPKRSDKDTGINHYPYINSVNRKEIAYQYKWIEYSFKKRWIVLDDLLIIEKAKHETLSKDSLIRRYNSSDWDIANTYNYSKNPNKMGSRNYLLFYNYLFTDNLILIQRLINNGHIKSSLDFNSNLLCSVINHSLNFLELIKEICSLKDVGISEHLRKNVVFLRDTPLSVLGNKAHEFSFLYYLLREESTFFDTVSEEFEPYYYQFIDRINGEILDNINECLFDNIDKRAQAAFINDINKINAKLPLADGTFIKELEELNVVNISQTNLTIFNSFSTWTDFEKLLLGNAVFKEYILKYQEIASNNGKASEILFERQHKELYPKASKEIDTYSLGSSMSRLYQENSQLSPYPALFGLQSVTDRTIFETTLEGVCLVGFVSKGIISELKESTNKNICQAIIEDNVMGEEGLCIDENTENLIKTVLKNYYNESANMLSNEKIITVVHLLNFYELFRFKNINTDIKNNLIKYYNFLNYFEKLIQDNFIVDPEESIKKSLLTTSFNKNSFSDLVSGELYGISAIMKNQAYSNMNNKTDSILRLINTMKQTLNIAIGEIK